MVHPWGDEHDEGIVDRALGSVDEAVGRATDDEPGGPVTGAKETTTEITTSAPGTVGVLARATDDKPGGPAQTLNKQMFRLADVFFENPEEFTGGEDLTPDEDIDLPGPSLRDTPEAAGEFAEGQLGVPGWLVRRLPEIITGLIVLVVGSIFLFLLGNLFDVQVGGGS